MTTESILRPAPPAPIDRMRELHRRLVAGETLGKSAVASELGVDARTIQRDLARLRELGAPVIYDRLAVGHRYTHARWHFDPGALPGDGDDTATTTPWSAVLRAPVDGGERPCGPVSVRLSSSEQDLIADACERDALHVERHADGSATVHLPVASLHAVRRMVLELEGRAEVVTPACLRDAVVEAAVALLRRHECDPAAA